MANSPAASRLGVLAGILQRAGLNRGGLRRHGMRQRAAATLTTKFHLAHAGNEGVHTMTTVIHGESGSGKTLHATALAAHYGLSRIVDEWVGGTLPRDSLVLTRTPVPGSIDIHDALTAACITA